MPKLGRGQATQMASFLKVNSVFISQVLKADREFSLEQGHDLAEYLGLNELEKRYFLAMIQWARAGNFRLRAYFSKQMEELRNQAHDLSKRLPAEKTLSIAEANLYYSSWIYSAARLATSIPELNTLEALSNHFKISRVQMKKVLDFLMEHGLCLQKGQQYLMGPRSTHLAFDSPIVFRHHSNWRLKGLSRTTPPDSDEIYYTSPVSISESDIPKVRKMILKWIEDFSAVVKDSPSEKVACLNIDWFKI